jgi:DNA replication protein DnaC
MTKMAASELPTTLTDEIRRDLVQLKLLAIAEGFDLALEEAQTTQQGYATFLAALLRRQILHSRGQAARRRIQAAQFPENKTFDRFNWTFQPGLNVQLVKDLMTLDFISQSRTVLMLGKPGTGKTHMSIALGHLAAAAGYRVRFLPASALLGELYASLADGSTAKLIRKLGHADLLIIDDLRHLPPRPEYASLLYELVEARYRKKATLLSSNLDVAEWGNVLGNPILTASLVDRLMDRAHIINIKRGKSYRTQGPEAPPEADRPAALCTSEGADA